MYSQPWSPTPSTTARGTGVADGEPFAGQAAEVRPAGRGAVEDGVADDHVLFGDERRAVGRAHRQDAAGEPLADVVVRVADQRQLDAGREPARRRTVPAEPSQREPDRPGRESRRSVRLRHRMREQAADRTVDVADVELGLDGRSILDRRPCLLDQLPVERVVKGRDLRLHASDRYARRDVERLQQRREIETPFLPPLDRIVGLEQIGTADQVVEAPDAETRHDPARLLGDEEHEVDDVLGLAGEALPQLGILRRDPDRTGVEMAGAHHYAPRRDQRRRREAHLVRAEERCDDDVSTGLQLAVRLHPDA